MRKGNAKDKTKANYTSNANDKAYGTARAMLTGMLSAGQQTTRKALLKATRTARRKGTSTDTSERKAKATRTAMPKGYTEGNAKGTAKKQC